MRDHDCKLAKPLLVFGKKIFQRPNIRNALHAFVQLS